MKNLSKEQLVKKILDNNEYEGINNYEELLDALIDEPISINIEKTEKRTIGEKLADKITEIAGSWAFIFLFVFFLIAWMIINVLFIDNVDPYPFILLNLILSCIAAIQAPIIMMSQNREAKKESLKSTNDYKTNIKSELILEELHDKIELILKNQKEILKYLDEYKK
ncbi:MAG: DUF1003 domain-containing protein [bacterium]|nr:DUF1003 domain-containing protein [bacterium]